MCAAERRLRRLSLAAFALAGLLISCGGTSGPIASDPTYRPEARQVLRVSAPAEPATDREPPPTDRGAPPTDRGAPATDHGAPATDRGAPATPAGDSSDLFHTPAPLVAEGQPMVLYTDLTSGPNRGGERDKGAYLSIFGKGFGTDGLGSRVKVTIGGVEVDNYRYLGPSRGRPDIEQISVQIGALGDPTPGRALPIRVLVDGRASNDDRHFIVNPGRILFVDNVSGDDERAAPDDIARPYRHVQTPNLARGGAWPRVRAGDIIVMRGHGASRPWTDVGFQNYFMRFRDKSGSAPTGEPGTGPIALVGYPGEDVYIRGTLAGGMTRGCLSAVNGLSFPGMGQWVVVANLRIDCEGYDGPISQQIRGHHWRVVNNDLSASTAPRSGPAVPRMAGITGNGRGSVWYGNRIHDIQGSAQECHGLYIDGDGSYDIGYNFIHDIRDGNGFQVYVNGRNGSDVADSIALHHNLIREVSKHGINIADGARAGIRVWNNVVSGAQFAGVRLNSRDLVNARIHHNTFHAVNRARHPLYGALVNDWALRAGALDARNNVFHVAAGSPYLSGSVGFTSASAQLGRNLWANGAGAVALDRSAILADPGFVAPGRDFRPRPGSAAIGAGSALPTVTALVRTDHALRPRDGAPDVGALRP